VLTLVNPGARNALHPDMYAAGIEAIDAAERDSFVAALHHADGLEGISALLDRRPPSYRRARPR